MDRLKKITVEPDFDVWKEYAYQHQIHPAVLTYLEIKKDHFYQVESSIDGKQFVTARGWEDLSQMLRLFEKHQLPIDEKLTCQYLQNPEIAAQSSRLEQGKHSRLLSSQLEQLFLFCERAFPRGQELLLLVTELTINEASARFISRYGCPKYFEHNQELLFYERNQEILVKLEQLKL